MCVEDPSCKSGYIWLQLGYEQNIEKKLLERKIGLIIKWHPSDVAIELASYVATDKAIFSGNPVSGPG